MSGKQKGELEHPSPRKRVSMWACVAFHAITAQETEDRTRGEDSKSGSPRVFSFLSFMGVKRSVLHGSCEADDAFYLGSVKKMALHEPFGYHHILACIGLGKL
uniref:Uncharacterized protein n=1 Tax=Opuntia streptacantha TaxID=393608 RepID=A0A7C8ZFI1_OPUST